MAKTMSKIIHDKSEYSSEQTKQKGKHYFPFWHQLALGGSILISVFMNFFQLGQNGFGGYYPPAVRSMMDNWHNFFFASYDPGGFVTIDKPPLGFWLQVASAKLFGFTPFSVLLPQALAGVLSVALLYHLVRRHFGVMAGLLAALALALSPISVVTNRNVVIDSTLALTLLLGAWAVMYAAETGRLRWLLVSAIIVGLGFNIKMLEAYLVVPTFGLLYLLAAPRSIWRRVGHLALAGVVLLLVSFSWAAAVDLTPASQRPYVGSSPSNSEVSLALGYNGIDRLTRGFGGRPHTNTPTNAPNSAGNASGNGRSTATPAVNGNGNAGLTNTSRSGAGQQRRAGGFFQSGAPGPLRLFSQPLGAQIVWLLPLALFGMLALAWQRRPLCFQSDRRQQSLVFWGMWLLTMGTFFSVASFFHQYYMTEMAPAIAALSGIGLATMWQDYRRGGWRGWLLPLALIATVAEQVYILTSYPVWGMWLIPLMGVLCILAVGWFLIARIAPRIGGKAPSARSLVPALSLGIVSIMLAPTVWAVIPIIQNTPEQANLPLAGPSQSNNLGGHFASGRDENASTNPVLIRYLEANQGRTKFLLATPSSMTADSIILATNKPVMAMGGFSGRDTILTTSQLAALVANGTVRFFLIPEPLKNRPQQGWFGNGQQNALTTWVAQHCSTVPAGLWQSPSSSSSAGGGFGWSGTNQLYDCVFARSYHKGIQDQE